MRSVEASFYTSMPMQHFIASIWNPLGQRPPFPAKCNSGDCDSEMCSCAVPLTWEYLPYGGIRPTWIEQVSSGGYATGHM